ncbi:DinB family protein [Candidatus Viridilinea mediisalina]|uniref:Rubredoxin-type Fe(Cys)4 protein n=1 Tax=Candidatus Viridilinea mediisalina TaxID=2024553 RepID=A0A2A6RKJ5_9CHLR|nr:DinB family protein [Candidatus Viridilinea mediisalina]PDW03463.1 rubredoxin-type Fe(Cys)4 protein [Candidatus Viridilinea mediisalina]
MSLDEHEYRRLLCSMSLGYTAYHVWALQARRERKFNIARLLAAASSVKRIRAELAFRALGEVGKTSDNVARALAGLEPESVATGPVTGTGAISRDLLNRAARALAEGRDLLASELDDLFVCGGCGELMEGPTDACAICGTVREGFQSFRAAEAMGNLGPTSIMRRLEQSITTIHALMSDIDEELLAVRAVGGYSIKELIGHLADTDEVFRERAWLILELDEPRLPAAHPPKLAKAEVYRTHPLADLFEHFQNSRQQTLDLLRGLTAAAWRRTGNHPIFGIVPLTHQGNWVIEHERSHLVEMAQLRHDLLHQHDQFNPPVLPPNLVAEILEGE